jgi:hypothetical protein
MRQLFMTQNLKKGCESKGGLRPSSADNFKLDRDFEFI